MNFNRQLQRNIDGLSGVQNEQSTFFMHSEPIHHPLRTSHYSSGATYPRIKEDTPSRSKISKKDKVSGKSKQKDDKDVPVICTKGGVKAPFPVKLMDLLNLILIFILRLLNLIIVVAISVLFINEGIFITFRLKCMSATTLALSWGNRIRVDVIVVLYDKIVTHDSSFFLFVLHI